jgi:Pyruvate/2-oxoacid:ferredoxin oxidoreductase delta subunit
MTAKLQPYLRIVLYEGAGSQPLEDRERFEVLTRLLDKGYHVTSVRNGGQVSGETAHGALLVLGRFTGRQPSEVKAAGGARVLFRHLAGRADEVLAHVESLHGEAGTTVPGGWKPWFPAIDYSRCTNCMQCLTFCLFDVYGVSKDKQIRVQNPTNCKTDCPACSRVCPEVAILFPKYSGGPINGDEVRAEDTKRESMKVDISALLGGDLYAALRDRSAQARVRFAKERDEKRALNERRKCLTKLQEQLDIPPEVLASLPSLEEIQQKTARALAAAAPPGHAPGEAD